MKKVLALALVLVLALGMMVPATAAKKAIIDGFWSGMQDTDYTFVGDIHPGTDIPLRYQFNQFHLNDEAEAALEKAVAEYLLNNRDATLTSAYKKVIETIEPRFAVRKGGQIFSDISIDNIKGYFGYFNGNEIIRAVKAAALEAINKAEKHTLKGASGGTYTAALDKKVADEARKAINAWYLKWADIYDVDYDMDDYADIIADLFGTDDGDLLEAFDGGDAQVALYEKRIQDLVDDAFEKAYDEQFNLDGTFGGWTFDVLLETLDPWASVKDVDFEVDVYFLIDGKRTDNLYIHTVEGNFSNRVTDVDADTYDADSYEGQVIDAEEYVPSIAIVGNYEYDISANVKMARDKKIYFYVTTESDMSDEGIFDRYPSIEVAFKVLEVGLSSSYTGNFIKMGGVDSAYYVYGKGADGGLKYLGRGGEMLPFSAKYYVSTMKLDLSDDEPVDEIPVDVPSIVDDYNPSTGI